MHRPAARAKALGERGKRGLRAPLHSPGARQDHARARSCGRSLARRRLCAAAAFAALVAPLGAAADPLPNPVADSAQVWAFDGFALHPPPGEEWFSLVKSRARVVFAKRVADAQYGFVAVATTERLAEAPATADAVLAHVRARRPQAPEPARYEVVARDEALDAGAPPWCVRYRLQAEDTRASYFHPHIVRIAGRTCLHPDLPGLLVDASYAEWAIEGDERPAVRAEGEAFLAGLRLTGARGAAVLAEADAHVARGADAEAVGLLAPLAEGGDAQAALRLGLAYERGRGAPRDAAAAERWYRVAARAGEVDAQYNLATLLARGARDLDEAVRWFRRAADQRDAQAQLNLGLLHLKGEGVAPDRAAARYWLGLAGANGSARARDVLDAIAHEPASAAAPRREP